MSTRQIQSGQMDEAIRIIQETVVPAATNMPGFKGGLLLTDRSTGKFITIALWDTEADLRAYQVSSALDFLTTGPREREVFEVGAGESTLGRLGATRARVNYRQLQPDRMDEAISVYRDSVLPIVSARQGCVGGFVLTDSSTGKLVAVSLWASEADMRASQPPGDVDAIAGGPPVRELYEVNLQA
ncbi:MAG: antibiotic biosynthesis monooxygenase family protein [Dehalococcoidia bacterium]